MLVGSFHVLSLCSKTLLGFQLHEDNWDYLNSVEQFNSFF